MSEEDEAVSAPLAFASSNPGGAEQNDYWIVDSGANTLVTHPEDHEVIVRKLDSSASSAYLRLQIPGQQYNPNDASWMDQ